MNKLLFINKSIEEVFYLKSFQILNNFNSNKKEIFLNILIILDSNPEYFESCYKSIIKQKYTNYCIYLLYDNNYCISYAINHIDNRISNKLFFCNDYDHFINNFNQGYYIILNDSQKLVNQNVLKYINNNLNQNNNVKWSHYSNGKIINNNLKCTNNKNNKSLELPIILSCDNNSKF